MRKRKKALIDNGFISSNGICFGNDISLRYTKPHESVYFGISRAIFAFILSYAAMIMFSSFIISEISYAALLLCCSLPIALLCLLKIKNTGIRVIACCFLVFYFLFYLFSFEDLSNGFYSTVYLYLKHAKQPSTVLGTSLNGISPVLYPELASFFLNFLASVISVVVTVACVFRIDFPLLFVATFPLFELGMYWGWEAPLLSVVILIIGWVIVISLHTINQRTNKAGRRNTFAVHEKKHTYYLTSETEKSKVFFVLMRFMALLCAVIFILVIVLSNLLGHKRSETIERYRKNINNFVNNFTLEDLGSLFADYDGGFDLFGTKAVGGTNGGRLGDVDGISFNGTTALVVETAPFKDTLYLRGYVAGDYSNNQWDPINYSSSESFAKDFEELGICPQDLNYFELTDLTNLLSVNSEQGGDDTKLTQEDEISISVKSASKKYVYAPYASYYSAYEQRKDYKMRPYLDSYVRLGTNSYSIKYRKPDPDSELFDQIQQSIANKDNIYKRNSTIPYETIEAYDQFVKDKYSKVTESNGLNAAYREIDEKYLNGNRKYVNVVSAISAYFTDNNFKYTLDPGKTPKGEEFVDYFLSTQKKGYCSYYASAGVQLLRKFGFQARFVEGYVVLPTLCDKNAETCSIDVTDKCAHAWTEVYIEDYGWICVDFTPGYYNDNPNMTEKEKNPNGILDESSSLPDNSSSQPESSAPESSSQPDSDPSTSSSSESSNSVPDTSVSRPDTSSPDQSGGGSEIGSSSDHSGGSTTSNKDSTSVRPYAPGNGGNGKTSSSVKIIIAVIIITVLFFAVLILRRILSLRTRERNCFDGKPIDRLKFILKYSIEYLMLLDINVGENITDMQLCEELDKKLEEKDVHISKELEFLFRITEDAYMGEHEPSEEELDKAYEYLNYIAHIVVRPKLSPLKYVSTMFINGIY